jgi:hypothetical protein
MVLLYHTHTLPIDLLKLNPTTFLERPKTTIIDADRPIHNPRLKNFHPRFGGGEHTTLLVSHMPSSAVITEGSVEQENDGDESPKSFRSDDPEIMVLGP